MMTAAEREEVKKVCIEGQWDDDDWAWIESALHEAGFNIDDDDVTIVHNCMTSILEVKGDKAEQWSRFLEDRGIATEASDCLERERASNH